MRRGMANTNEHDTNKHGLKNEHKRTHARTNNGLRTRERGDAREERRREQERMQPADDEDGGDNDDEDDEERIEQCSISRS